MATNTKSRAARNAARVSDATAVKTRAVNATGVAVATSALASAQMVSQAAASTVMQDGWDLCKAECLARTSGISFMALHDDKLGRAFFGYGYTAAFLLSRNVVAAVSAAKSDNKGWEPVVVDGRVTNWPELGETLLAYGRLVMDRGVSPPKAGSNPRTLKAGEFIRLELEQAAYKASNAAWSRVTSEPKEKKERTPRAAKGKGATTFKIDALPKVKGVKEVSALAETLASALEKLAKAHANDLSLKAKEAIAAAVAACREDAEKAKA